MRRTLLYVAIHEAGHAVARLASEDPRYIEHLSIRDQPDGQLGFTAMRARFQPAWVDAAQSGLQIARLRRNAWLDIVDTLAGPVAEARFRRASANGRAIIAARLAPLIADPNTILTDGEDAEKVRMRIQWLNPADPVAEIVRAYGEAEATLSRHWKRVVELGRWLHRDGHLNGEAVLQWWHRVCR